MATTTKWWWVRHAPVVGVEGVIYGSDDVDCDTSDRSAFEALAARLPEDAVWLTSHLTRAKETARAIRDAGLDGPDPLVERDFGEQCFGLWQGRTWNQMRDVDPESYDRFWERPARSRPPEGESFEDQIARTSAVIERVTAEHAGRDIVAVTHGGTIRAAISHALGLTPVAGMSFTVHNLSITRLEHVEGGLLRGKGKAWRVVSVNQEPR